MNKKMSTLQNKADRDGEKGFFASLREHATKPAGKRVENLLSLLVAADTLAREQSKQMRLCDLSGEAIQRSKSFRESSDASTRTHKLLTEALRRYRWQPKAQVLFGKFGIVESPVTTSTGQLAYWERGAVETLLRLAKKPGGLSRLRRCLECGQWFYANRDWQQFCGNACRRRHRAQNPEFKAARATYMRERYRPMEKEKEARSKRQAARVLSEKSKKGGR